GGKGTSGGPSGNFTAAKPPSGVCSMLTLTDVQGALPGAQDGVEQPTADTSAHGFWTRDCKWDGPTSATSLELVIFGALTSDGLAGIKLAARTGTTNNPVSGVGDEARYWEQSDVGTNGLWALRSPYSV